MVIVGGTFEVDPNKRELFLSSRHEMMRKSRAEPGCLEYTFSADPMDPGRVVLFERWASEQDLDAHLSVLRAAPASTGADIAAKSSSITIFDIARERPLGP